MKKLIIFILALMPLVCIHSVDLGAAISVDYFNNIIEDSAPSPIQSRPLLFHSLTLGFFSVRSGFAITSSIYEFETHGIPVFNDYYGGFSALEFDLFVYPGIIFKINKSMKVGISGGAGVRLPIITEVDKGIARDDADEALNWFYKENRFIFVGGDLFTYVNLPIGDNVSFYGAVNYKNFINRTDSWTVGASAGLLWQF